MLGERHLLREMRQLHFQSIEWRKLCYHWPLTVVFVFVWDPGANTHQWTQTHATYTNGKKLGYLLPLKNNSFEITMPKSLSLAVFHPHLFTDIQFNFKGKLIYHLTLSNVFLEENGWNWFKRDQIGVDCKLNSMASMFALFFLYIK